MFLPHSIITSLFFSAHLIILFFKSFLSPHRLLLLLLLLHHHHHHHHPLFWCPIGVHPTHRSGSQGRPHRVLTGLPHPRPRRLGQVQARDSVRSQGHSFLRCTLSSRNSSLPHPTQEHPNPPPFSFVLILIFFKIGNTNYI